MRSSAIAVNFAGSPLSSSAGTFALPCCSSSGRSPSDRALVKVGIDLLGRCVSINPPDQRSRREPDAGRRTRVRVGGAGEDVVKRSRFVRTRDEEVDVGGSIERREGQCQAYRRIGRSRHRHDPTCRLCQRR